MMRRLLCLFLLVAVAAATDISKPGRKRYDGYQVLEISTKDDAQKEAVHKLFDGDMELDVWSETRYKTTPVLVMVPPHKLQSVDAYLQERDIKYSVFEENVQNDLDEELSRLQERFRLRQDQFAFDINDYNTYEDIMLEMENMVGRCPSGFTCETYNAGNSYYDRQIKVLKISKAGAGRQAYWMDSAIHAREWLAPATNLKILNHMLTNYGSDPEVTPLLDDYDWYFVPIMNPDGYVYSWESDRFWRKNLSPNAGSLCAGTDLNRNYDASWASDGTSTDPCSDIFHGSGPGSEVETIAIQSQANQLGSTLRAWVTIHTAAQMWLMPWGYTTLGFCTYPEDHDDMQQVADAAADAVEATHITIWTRGNCCETIYAASGSTMDYAKASGGVKYTFTPELRGPGFNPGPEQIQPSFEEVWEGILAMVAEITAIEG